MEDLPDVAYLATSNLREQLEAIDWQEVSVGALDLAQLPTDPRRAHVLVLSAEEAPSGWGNIEEHVLDLPWYPVIVSDKLISQENSPFLRLAPVHGLPLNESMLPIVRELLQQSAWLYRELKRIDGEAELLTQNAQCEWDRCSVGIVGIVRVQPRWSVSDLKERLKVLRANAYAAVDRLPTSSLSVDDLWTLLLIVAVPWSREQLGTMNSESAILREFVGDTMGSRKVIMCTDESISGLLGPIVGHGSMWYPTSDDPLREELRAAVTNNEELQALEVLFKKRFSADDVDRLIFALGKKQ